jgi:hypothetical protein
MFAFMDDAIDQAVQFLAPARQSMPVFHWHTGVEGLEYLAACALFRSWQWGGGGLIRDLARCDKRCCHT